MLNKRKNTDESGVVSLLVVSVLAVVLALVSIGFSHLMDRELRQAEDRELSAQAYYSAEAGINDARSYLQADTDSFTGCATPASAAQFVSSGDLSNGSDAARYSCVSVDTTPTELIYALAAGQSITFKVSQAEMASMYFGWENQSYPNGPQPLGGIGTLPREDQIGANSTGVLRVGLYPVPTTMPGGISNTNDYLSYISRTYFMYPNGGSGSPGSVSYSSNNGSFVPGNCNVSRPIPINNPSATPRYCNSVITNLSGSSNTYYVRLTAEYAPLNVSIQTTNGTNSTPLSFNNVQAIVDVTGAGTDVLQRIRARIDLANNYEAPSYGLQSMVAICKGFRVYVTDLGQYGNVMPPDQSVNNSDGACAQPNGGGSISGGGLGPLSSRSCPSPYAGTEPDCDLPNFSGSGLHMTNAYIHWTGVNNQLELYGTVNDNGVPGVEAWFQYDECGTFAAFPTSQQAIPPNKSDNAIHQTVYPFSVYYCGYNNPSHFRICANSPTEGTVCSDPYAVSQ
ncbi:MAG TPA: hypothetical protein VHD84_02510 [Candidatus Saccharimonadales bacterium]|nr:hypothetical protein [Candidatus Saccharimonadales bacterium]